MPLMPRPLLLTSTLLLLLLAGCDPERPKPDCFADAPLETIPWAKDLLASFRQPRSGPLRVVVYAYRNEQFLAFENPVLSSPMSYIFDCSGTSIGQKNIHYNDFTREAKKLKVLHQGKY
jgi:hypothetical protein